jgi:mono/diheme cytochrome c family protein
MRVCLVLGVLVVGMALASRADEPKKLEPPGDAMADKVPTFKADVAPLFKDACSSCHGGLKPKAKLDVSSYDSVMKFVKAGEPDKSKLHMAVTGKGAKQMPPKNPLADDQVALIKAWITGGAKKD